MSLHYPNYENNEFISLVLNIKELIQRHSDTSDHEDRLIQEQRIFDLLGELQCMAVENNNYATQANAILSFKAPEANVYKVINDLFDNLSSKDKKDFINENLSVLTIDELEEYLEQQKEIQEVLYPEMTD